MESSTHETERKQMALALLIIRIAASLGFIFHGGGILFGLFGGPGLLAFSENIGHPEPIGFLVGLAELGGGIAYLTGILTRLGAAGIIMVMLGAIFTVHLKNGFDISKGGYEYALTQLLIAVGLLVSGAGPYSLTHAMGITPRDAKPTRRNSASGAPTS